MRLMELERQVIQYPFYVPDIADVSILVQVAVVDLYRLARFAAAILKASEL